MSIYYTALIITLSDRAFKAVYEDESGPELSNALTEYIESKGFMCNIETIILPDDPDELNRIVQQAISENINFIFTTGGTGIGPRDITPEVIRPLLTKEIPGIMEVVRVKYGLQFPKAALSRSIAGVSGNSLIYCLPGNPNAVREYMGEILKTLLHCYQMIRGEQH